MKNQWNVLGGVRAEAVARQAFQQPARPVFELLRHGGIAELHVGAHQIVVVAFFVVDLIVPAVVAIVVGDFEHPFVVRLLNVVDAAEACVIPDKLGMHATAAGKGEAGVGQRVEALVVDVVAVVGVHLEHVYLFFLVRAELVVEHHVVEYPHAVFAQRSGGVFERRLIAVFGGHAAFLVKFAEIEQIVSIVADGVAAGSALVGRRQPQVGNAQFGQCGARSAASCHSLPPSG